MSDAPAYTQAGRLLRIDTPLGEDVLLLERFDGTEEISELFAFTAVARSKRTDLQASDLVGKLVDVSLNLCHGEADGGPDQELRTWNCLCVALHEGERVARDMRHYMLTLRPQLWLLTQRADCRIFLDKSSTEICQLMLSEHGLPAPDTSGLVGPVRLYAGPALAFDVQVALARKGVLPTQLSADAASRLGWTTCAAFLPALADSDALLLDPDWLGLESRPAISNGWP